MRSSVPVGGYYSIGGFVMPPKSKVPVRNRSETGWWVFNEVTQWVSNRKRRLSHESRFLVWVNTRILQAKDRDEAYRKALAFGRLGRPCRARGGEWRFAGISLLFPIYEDLQDGAEILWTDRGRIPLATIKKLVKKKRHLLVFNDHD